MTALAAGVLMANTAARADITIGVSLSLTGPWAYMLRYISDRIAPIIGPPKAQPALQAKGYLPNFG